ARRRTRPRSAPEMSPEPVDGMSTIELPQTATATMNPLVVPSLVRFALVSACLAGSSHAGEGKLVIEAGRIVTQAGPDIENGRIVIEGGRIAVIGKADEVEK